MNLTTGGMGKLGSKQLAWLPDDLKGKSPSTPLVLPHAVVEVAANWGRGTDDAAQVLNLVKPFGSVTGVVLRRAHPPKFAGQSQAHVRLLGSRKTRKTSSEDLLPTTKVDASVPIM